MVVRVVRDNESVVEKIARVTFFAVGVEYLYFWRNILQALNNKTLLLIDVIPGCLFGKAMVEHICEGSQDVCFDPVDKYSKNATTNNGSCPAKISKFIFFEVTRDHEDSIVVSFEVQYFFVDLHEERGTHKFEELFVGVVDGEIGVIFRQQAKVMSPVGFVLFDKFLQQKDCEVGMFWRDDFNLTLYQLLADGVLSGYFESDEMRFGYEYERLIFLFVISLGTLMGVFEMTPRYPSPKLTT